ncbi:serine/threonine protein phosphatase [Paenibacillus sp. VCA1]|uniref:serine/threonine protein phosphatase n=1 Tax=Paenibacillus sp. VCA1 TaxID=3039148 RepID=UPI002871E14C|nr:serine/threonine protein phosphatase [Paenibacillus sp. VCA1]MDR9856614.1 serine/threonine protein phosphatase [Paenibacillus sp. VCA1]
MRKENSDFQTAFVSEAGSFVDNRDYFAFVELDDMACYVIADGLDQDRELRSAEMAVSAILESFMEKPSLSKRSIRRYLETAHEWLKFESRRVRLKASVLVVVTNYTKMVWASCGNARLYHFRGGRLNLRSTDQSLSQLLLENGKLSEDRISSHEERGNLLNYMGKPDHFDPFISKKTPLADGDVLLLCTPGVWEQVELPEMLDALAESSDPAALTDTLEEIVLSKQRQTVSNYTAAAVYANKTFAEKPKNRKKWILRMAVVLVTLMLAGGGVWYMKAKQAQTLAQTAMQMAEYEQSGDEYASAGDYAKALKAYSEAKNAASKLKDKLHFQLLRGKQQVAQAVTDGDGYVKDGSYDMAVNSYTKALKDAGKYKPFKPEDIQAKIDRSGKIAELAEIIKDGDKKVQAQDYSGALKTYEKAKNAAIEAGYESGQKQIEKKMAETQEKIDGIERETKTLQADNLEKKGDRSMAAMDYAGAIEAYGLAQEIYQEIDKLERVLAMERKISKADEKLHPVVPAGDGPGAGTAAAGFPSGADDWGSYEPETPPAVPTGKKDTVQTPAPPQEGSGAVSGASSSGTEKGTAKDDGGSSSENGQTDTETEGGASS